MSVVDIQRELDQTRRFAERQKLLKELWKIERAELSEKKRKKQTTEEPTRVSQA